MFIILSLVIVYIRSISPLEMNKTKAKSLVFGELLQIHKTEQLLSPEAKMGAVEMPLQH